MSKDGSGLKGTGTRLPGAADARRYALTAAALLAMAAVVVPLVAVTAIELKGGGPFGIDGRLASFFARPPWEWWAGMLAYGQAPPVLLGALAAAGAALLALRLTLGASLGGATAVFGPEASKAHVYGSADVDTKRSELLSNTPTWDPGEEAESERGGGSIVLGYDAGRFYVSPETVHATLYGPPGFGKTRAYLIPSVYHMAARGDSIVVTDSQGEIYSKMHRQLEAMGYACPIFDLKNTKRSWLYNPLDPITTAYRDHVASAKRSIARALDELSEAEAGGERAEEAMGEYRRLMACADTEVQEAATIAQRFAMDVASCIVPVPAERTDAAFWQDSSRGVITACILFVCTYDRADVMVSLERELAEARKAGDKGRAEAVLERLRGLPPAIADEQRTLATVYTMLAELTGTVKVGKKSAELYGKGEVMELEQVFNVLPLDHPANWAFSQMRKSADKTLMNIVTSAINDLRRSIPGPFKEISYASEIDLASVGRDKVALFIVTPPKNPELATPAVIMLNQLFNTIVDAAEANGGQVERRTQFVLEEFGNLPVAIPSFANNLAVCRKYDVHYTLCVQNWALVEEKYGKAGTKAIRGTISTDVYLGTEDMDMAREVSERIGVETIEVASASRTADGDPLGSRWSSSKRYDRRDWLTVAEARAWNARYSGAIVFRAKNDIEPAAGARRVKPAIFPYADVSDTKLEKALELGRAHRRQIAERMMEDEAADRRLGRAKRLSVWRASHGSAIVPNDSSPFPALPSVEVESLVHDVAYARGRAEGPALPGKHPEAAQAAPAKEAPARRPVERRASPSPAHAARKSTLYKSVKAARKQERLSAVAALGTLAGGLGVAFDAEALKGAYNEETERVLAAIEETGACPEGLGEGAPSPLIEQARQSILAAAGGAEPEEREEREEQAPPQGAGGTPEAEGAPKARKRIRARLKRPSGADTRARAPDEEPYEPYVYTFEQVYGKTNAGRGA